MNAMWRKKRREYPSFEAVCETLREPDAYEAVRLAAKRKTKEALEAHCEVEAYILANGSEEARRLIKDRQRWRRKYYRNKQKKAVS